MPGRLWRFSWRDIASLINGSLSKTFTALFETLIIGRCTSNALLETVDVAFIAENLFFGLKQSLSKSSIRHGHRPVSSAILILSTNVPVHVSVFAEHIRSLCFAIRDPTMIDPSCGRYFLEDEQIRTLE